MNHVIMTMNSAGSVRLPFQIYNLPTLAYTVYDLVAYKLDNINQVSWDPIDITCNLLKIYHASYRAYFSTVII
jgi:hypothetical protein